MFPSQGPQNRPSGAPVILGQGPVSRDSQQPSPLDSENRSFKLPDDPFIAQPSNQQWSEPQTGQVRIRVMKQIKRTYLHNFLLQCHQQNELCSLQGQLLDAIDPMSPAFTGVAADA
jgi:hypothetical protein